MEGRETKVKQHGHHGKGKQKKEKTSGGPNGVLRTDSLGVKNSSLAPADFCNVEAELDELEEDDELQIFRALVLDLSYRYLCKIRSLAIILSEEFEVIFFFFFFLMIIKCLFGAFTF